MTYLKVMKSPRKKVKPTESDDEMKGKKKHFKKFLMVNCEMCDELFVNISHEK